jgi:hypothetical protein
MPFYYPRSSPSVENFPGGIQMQLSLIDSHAIQGCIETAGKEIKRLGIVQQGLHEDGRLGRSGKITRVVTVRWDLDDAQWAFEVYRTEDFKRQERDLFNKLQQVDKQTLEGQLKARGRSYNHAIVGLFPRGFKEELVFGLAML